MQRAQRNANINDCILFTGLQQRSLSFTGYSFELMIMKTLTIVNHYLGRYNRPKYRNGWEKNIVRWQHRSAWTSLYREVNFNFLRDFDLFPLTRFKILLYLYFTSIESINTKKRPLGRTKLYSVCAIAGRGRSDIDKWAQSLIESADIDCHWRAAASISLSVDEITIN